MKRFANMCDAYQALLDGELAAGDQFTAANQPGRIFLVAYGHKIREVRP